MTQIGVSGPLLGGFPEVGWDELTFGLHPGSTLLTYTDGVTDALRGGRVPVRSGSASGHALTVPRIRGAGGGQRRRHSAG